MTTATLIDELRRLGLAVPPEGSAERVWMRVLGETAHPVEADSPFSPEGIAGHAPSDLPGLRDCAEMPVGARE